MLTTHTRFCQAQDPTLGAPGVARERGSCGAVTAAAYPSVTTAPSATTPGFATARHAAIGTGLWTVIERNVMPKVDFHDRWPLLSPS